MKQFTSLLAGSVVLALLLSVQSAEAKKYDNIQNIYRNLHFSDILECNTPAPWLPELPAVADNQLPEVPASRYTRDMPPKLVLTGGDVSAWPSWIDKPVWMY